MYLYLLEESSRPNEINKVSAFGMMGKDYKNIQHASSKQNGNGKKCSNLKKVDKWKVKRSHNKLCAQFFSFTKKFPSSITPFHNKKKEIFFMKIERKSNKIRKNLVTKDISIFFNKVFLNNGRI